MSVSPKETRAERRARATAAAAAESVLGDMNPEEPAVLGPVDWSGLPEPTAALPQLLSDPDPEDYELPPLVFSDDAAPAPAPAPEIVPPSPTPTETKPHGRRSDAQRAARRDAERQARRRTRHAAAASIAGDVATATGIAARAAAKSTAGAAGLKEVKEQAAQLAAVGVDVSTLLGLSFGAVAKALPAEWGGGDLTAEERLLLGTAWAVPLAPYLSGGAGPWAVAAISTVQVFGVRAMTYRPPVALARPSAGHVRGTLADAAPAGTPTEAELNAEWAAMVAKHDARTADPFAAATAAGFTDNRRAALGFTDLARDLPARPTQQEAGIGGDADA